MLVGIPQQRLLIYLAIVATLPILWVINNLSSQSSQMTDFEQSIESIHQQVRLRVQRNAINQRVLAHFKDADHFYIDKHLESLIFLEPEIEALEQAIKDSPVGPSPEMQRRLDYLTGPSNSLSFSEGSVQSFSVVQEVTDTMVHPVEVSTSDLQKILARIEGKPIGEFEPATARPLLLVLDFKLEKKQISSNHDVFTLFMRLLKREFL